MKKSTRKKRAVALLISLALLFSMIPASAYASDIPLVLSMPVTEIDVIVSERVLLDGQAGTADLSVSPLTVTNNGNVGTIVVSEISVATQNGWNLASKVSGFEKMGANVKKFYLGYKDHDFVKGSFTGTIAELAPGNTSTIQLSAMAGAQTEAISDITIANVVLTINLKENAIRWGCVYTPQISTYQLPGFVFYEDGSMDFGSFNYNTILSLPAGSLTYTENSDGTVTAVSNTDEGTNTFFFSSDLTFFTVESSYLDSISDISGITDMTYKWTDVNIHFGEEYCGFWPLNQNEDGSILEEYRSFTFETNGACHTVCLSSEFGDVGPFTYYYINEGSHAKATNWDVYFDFDESGKIALLYGGGLGDYNYSVEPSEGVINAVAWEEKYTSEVDGESISFEFYLDGTVVTAKAYTNGVYETSLEGLSLMRLNESGTMTYGIADMTSGLQIMFLDDAATCIMVAPDGTELTLTLEQ